MDLFSSNYPEYRRKVQQENFRFITIALIIVTTLFIFAMLGLFNSLGELAMNYQSPEDIKYEYYENAVQNSN